MSKLQKIQQDMKDYIVGTNPTSIKSAVSGDKRFTQEMRLGVYYDAYRLRLIEVLEKDYPKLHSLVGDEAFYDIAQSYVEAYPSDVYSLRYFGRHMLKFLTESNQQRNNNEVPEIVPEMAKFEWGINHTLDAADSEICTINTLSTIPQDEFAHVRFKFHPSFQIMNFNYNTVEFWQAIDSEVTPPEIIRSEKPITWVLWRKDIRTFFLSMDKPQAYAIKCANENKSFGEICEGLIEYMNEEEVPEFAAKCISTWLNEEMIAEITF